MNPILLWICCYLFTIFNMCIDNICWISSSPEYDTFKKLKWFLLTSDFIVRDNKLYHTKLSYIFEYRIWSVLTDWRDIIPATITSTALTIFFILVL